METRGPQVHIEKDEARSGSTANVVRYVLGISLALAVVALTAIWVTGAVTSSGDTGADTARAAHEAGDGPP